MLLASALLTLFSFLVVGGVIFFVQGDIWAGLACVASLGIWSALTLESGSPVQDRDDFGV